MHTLTHLLTHLLLGSFTYILPSSKLVPKMVIETGNNKFKRRWKRKEIGIRMPADDITAEVLSGVDEPLLTGAHSLTHSLTH